MISRRVALLEAVHYASLLTESQRMDYVVKNHGAALEQKFATDRNPEDVVHDVEAQPGESTAEKIVNFVSQFDPTPKKLYTLWLVQRHLRNEVKLEDMAGATDLLAYFDHNKRRFEKRDINQYRSIDELSQAVNAFFAAAPQEQLRNDADMQVWYDSPNLAIIQPKSMKGAVELGQGTIWCTAWMPESRNRFRYYSDGPIFVIIDKAKNARWQFYFCPRASRSEFMDRSNSAIDLGAFLRTYPVVFKVIGADRFFPYVNKICLEFFSEEQIATIPPNNLVQAIRDVGDLSKLPQERLQDREFALSLLGGIFDALENRDALKRIMGHFAQLHRDDAFWFAFLDENPTALPVTPTRFHTDDRKIAQAQAFNSYKHIEREVAKPWPDAVSQRFYSLSAAQDVSLRVKDIPVKFRNSHDLARVMNRHKEDLVQHKDLLNEQLVAELVNMDWKNFEKVPAEFITKEVAAKVGEIAKNLNSYSAAETMRQFSRLDPSMWPVSMASKILTQAKDLPFERIPQDFRTEPLLIHWIKANGDNYFQLPPRYITEGLFTAAIKTNMREEVPTFVKKLTPQNCPEEVFLAFLPKSYDFYYVDDMATVLPEHLRTVRVFQALMGGSRCPIKAMPKSLMTPDAIHDRVKQHPKEAADIPRDILDKGLAARIVETNQAALQYMPDSILCEDVLYHWLRAVARIRHGQQHSYYTSADDKEEALQKQFKRFSSDMWSPRVVAMGLDARLIEPDLDSIPKEFHDSAVVASVLARNATQMAKADRSLVDQAALIKGVSNNFQLIERLRPDHQTEPVIFAALHAHAETCRFKWENRIRWWGRSQDDEHGEKGRAILNGLNKENWSPRCYEAAVGYVVNIKDVPKKLRTPELTIVALKRDPTQAAFLPEAAKFIDQHMDEFRAKLKDKDWANGLGSVGVFKKGRGMVDVKTSDAQPLSKGYSFSIVPTGPENMRVFLMDAKKNIVARLYTEKGKINTPNVRELKDNADRVIEMVKADPTEFRRYEYNVLNEVGLYRWNGNPVTVTEMPRKKWREQDKLEWASMSHVEGTKYVGFFKNKPVLELYEAKSAAIYGKGTISLQEGKVLAKPVSRLWPLSKEIAEYMEKHVDHGWSWELYDIGINCGKRSDKPWNSFLTTKVTEFGSLTVFRDQRKITLMHSDHGYLAQGTLRNSGAIEDINYHYSTRGTDADLRPVIDQCFAALQGKIPL